MDCPKCGEPMWSRKGDYITYLGDVMLHTCFMCEVTRTVYL